MSDCTNVTYSNVCLHVAKRYLWLFVTVLFHLSFFGEAHAEKIGAHKPSAHLNKKINKNDALDAYRQVRENVRHILSLSKSKKKKKDYDNAISKLNAVIKKYPNSDAVGRSLFLIAELHNDRFKATLKPKDAELAIEFYDKVILSHPQLSLADDAMWYKSEVLMKQRRDQEAYEEITHLIKRYPQSDMVNRAMSMHKILSGKFKLKSMGTDKRHADVRLASLNYIPDIIPERQDRLVNSKKNAKIYRVVLDPGHGGHDSGAIGPNGVSEKDVVLNIAKQAQSFLMARGIETFMTRHNDTFLSLQQRTQLANEWKADAFISIHANSAPRKNASGIETYTLDIASDRYAMRLAAIENKSSEKEVSDLQLILADLSTKGNTHDSSRLAHGLQTQMVQSARQVGHPAKNLGVKSSLFYVLLGAHMPSTLVETSFISNRDEERLLGSVEYQRRLGQAISDAVVQYFNRSQ